MVSLYDLHHVATDVTLCEWCHCIMLHHVSGVTMMLHHVVATDVTSCEWCHCMMLHHVVTDDATTL